MYVLQAPGSYQLSRHSSSPSAEGKSFVETESEEGRKPINPAALRYSGDITPAMRASLISTATLSSVGASPAA